MILRLTEGSLSPVSCLDNDPVQCERYSICETVMIWQRLRDAINSVIDNVTIQDLVDKHNESNASDDYVI